MVALPEVEVFWRYLRVSDRVEAVILNNLGGYILILGVDEGPGSYVRWLVCASTCLFGPVNESSNCDN